MTRTMSNIETTKTMLLTAAQALPDGAAVRAMLGLGGDCDFAAKATEAHPFLCPKSDLLSLIGRQQQEVLAPMAGAPNYLVLAHRYAVYLPDVLESGIPDGGAV